MYKKMLTLFDLEKFCETKNFARFSSAESGYQLCVSVPATFEQNQEDDSLMLFADVKLMHTDKNRNKSALTEKGAKKCLSSIAYKPVLANFAEFDGEWDFTSHDVDIDKDGNFIYIERQVGCFTADKPTMDSEPDSNGRKYIYARVAIPREYTRAADIIERKKGTKVSVELAVNEMSYSAEEKILYLDDVEVMGVTLLGRDPDTGEEYQEGMEGARLDIADFSVQNNSIIANQKLIESLDKLTTMLANFNINPAQSGDSKEGGNDQVRFNELLERYGKTVEDITFEYENLSDEELEEAFKTAFDGEEQDPSEEPPSEPTDAEIAAGVETLINALPVTVATTDEAQIVAAREAYDALTDAQKALITEEVLAILTGAEASLGEAKAAAANQTAADAVATAINALTTASSVTLDDAEAIQAARQAYDSLTAAQKELVESTVLAKLTAAEEALNEVRAQQDDGAAPKKKRQNNELTYTVEVDGETKTFSVSLVDKLSALSALVNNTYSEADDAWYDVDAYDDEKYVIMHDYWRNKHYRQSYAVKKDVYSLKGDRVEVFARYLTNDEISKLDNMKADYAVVTEKLGKYEAEPKKMEILNSEDYAKIFDVEEFVELKKEENHFDMSVEDVRSKADEMLLAYAKSGKIDFSENSKKEINIKKFSKNTSGKTGRYGSLFKK